MDGGTTLSYCVLWFIFSPREDCGLIVSGKPFPVCKPSAALTDHYVKCQLAFKLWLRQLSSKATVLWWITALCEVSSVDRWSADMWQQALIPPRPIAVPDPRWNETSNCVQSPIRIKIPVSLVDWGSKLIWDDKLIWQLISTVHDADIQSFSIWLLGKKVFLMSF